MYFKFEVKNTGNVPLSSISLTDIPFIDFSNANIPSTLQPGKSFKVIIGPINVGSFQNTDKATVTGTYEGCTYSDCDIANYYGTLRTYTACEYGGTGTAIKLLNTYFKTPFINGMEIGKYKRTDGYGYKWTSTT